MDELTRAFYEMRLYVEYRDRDGNGFQDFFAKAMGLIHPGDFMQIRPWGRAGDRKNDGYLRSERTLFQVYAPNDMRASEAVAKIHEDFYGAIPYWIQYFSTWVFVHNSHKGLSPFVADKLLALEADHSEITVKDWGHGALRERVFRLAEPDLAALLGPVPTRSDMNALGFNELIPVLKAIQRQPPSLEQDIHPVPADKVRLNDLSSDVESMLKVGMTRARLVEDFFNRYPDPAYGDELAVTFKKTYEAFRDQGLNPDATFMELIRFVGGAERGAATHETAVLAIVAYFFEQCDIYKNIAPGEIRS